MDLQTLKNMYIESLDYANDNSSFFVPINYDLTNYLKKLAASANTLADLMTVVNIPNPTWQNSFDKPQPIQDADILKTTGFRFGESSVGWYFCIGNTTQYGYCLTITRVEIAPPEVVKKYTSDPSTAVVWSVLGGFGKQGGPWISIPFNWFQSTYTLQNPDTSAFTLISKPNSPITLNMTVLNKIFNINVSFLNWNIQTVLTNTINPKPNSQFSCSNCGQYGIQSLYWSYTNPSVTLKISDTTSGTPVQTYQSSQPGTGWIDHQTFSNAIDDSLSVNLTYNSMLMFVTPPPIAWIWMFIQVETDGVPVQYMLFSIIDPSKFKSGVTFDASQFCNIYNTNTVSWNGPNCSKADVTVGQTYTLNGFTYPVDFIVTIPDGLGTKVRTRAEFRDLNTGLSMNGSFKDSYEMPGSVYTFADSTFTTPIGTALLEINGATPLTEVYKRMAENYKGTDVDGKTVSLDTVFISKQNNYRTPEQKKVGFQWLGILIELATPILEIESDAQSYQEYNALARKYNSLPSHIVPNQVKIANSCNKDCDQVSWRTLGIFAIFLFILLIAYKMYF